VDIVAADISSNIAQLADLMVSNGHSRIPILSGDMDHVEGIAHARDILSQLGNNHDTPDMSVRSILRPALFIPESKTLEELLNDFQRNRNHMAIVIDEYGGVSGLVTIEDLLEEIVGEIQDEFDTSELEIEKVGEGSYLMDARVGIDDLNEMLDLKIAAVGFDTLGGLVYHLLGKVPAVGDVVEQNGLQVKVVSTAGRRLKRVRVTKTPPVDAKAS
jgi:CBS domain containing-hemolysin-like protein